MQIGIDKLAFATPTRYLEMASLAQARSQDPNKYIKGLGQEAMAVPEESDDAVSMAANASDLILSEADKAAIDMVIVGTESGVDQSKSVASWVHDLLGINPHARSLEIKQACYGATAGLKLAVAHLALNPDSKVLVIGSDIAKYGLETGGEPTQGAGAVAILVSRDPAIAVVNNDSAMLTKNIADFWRPNYSDYAHVDGKFSNQAYLSNLAEVWRQYKIKNQLSAKDFKAMVFHSPYTKMGKKALLKLGDFEDQEEIDRLLAYYEPGRYYNKRVGNIYTGSLYLSLISLLDQVSDLEAGDRIGLYSYGSGAVGEFFSIRLQPGYKESLQQVDFDQVVNQRSALEMDSYQDLLTFSLPQDGQTYTTDKSHQVPGRFVLDRVADHIRYYRRLA